MKNFILAAFYIAGIGSLFIFVMLESNSKNLTVTVNKSEYSEYNVETGSNFLFAKYAALSSGIVSIFIAGVLTGRCRKS
jgi:hypothetical protein